MLQHPHERSHPFGTAKLVRLCMPNADVHVPIPGFTGTLEKQVAVPDDAAVLFPHPDAPDLATLPPSQHPSTLIVLDGTWGHAKRLYRENSWLHDRPHVRLTPSAPSRYRIRREPKPEYISTIEAIVAALRLLEPEQHAGLDALLAAFDRMIDQQISHRSDRRVQRFKVHKHRESRARPAELADDRLIVAYAEARERDDDIADDRQLLHWVAARVRDGETFEAVLRVDAATMPSAAHLGHIGLTRTQLLQGEDIATARARFDAFIDGDAPTAAWTGTTFAWGRALLRPDSPRILLKTVYCNVSQRRAGYLEQVVAREGIAPPGNPLQGRAGARLANVLAIARWLRRR